MDTSRNAPYCRKRGSVSANLAADASRTRSNGSMDGAGCCDSRGAFVLGRGDEMPRSPTPPLRSGRVNSRPRQSSPSHRQEGRDTVHTGWQPFRESRLRTRDKRSREWSARLKVSHNGWGDDAHYTNEAQSPQLDPPSESRLRTRHPIAGSVPNLRRCDPLCCSWVARRSRLVLFSEIGCGTCHRAWFSPWRACTQPW